ncbi:eukaryotic translation initiation factor 2 subunit beta-like isoform X2 [Ananas comosus]|uniref:Eukaryotic translation initiation factor 2 subunit beta-like isoform X2 n=1 Tax=Ananas comosus TaxID=4615 RepID=A0A6P5GLU9_ANACO|nr:eukaryotic translation initiation factor 2 subunit beta-like isoform X2 [Ananas comosus]
MIVQLAPFDPTKKKKKKKNVVIQDPADEVDKLAEKTKNLTVAESGEPSFAGMKKKKKKPVETDFLINDENGKLERMLLVSSACHA